MIALLFKVLIFAGGFVFGVLFTRKNTKKVEKALAEAKAEISKLSGGKLNV